MTALGFMEWQGLDFMAAWELGLGSVVKLKKTIPGLL